MEQAQPKGSEDVHLPGERVQRPQQRRHVGSLVNDENKGMALKRHASRSPDRAGKNRLDSQDQARRKEPLQFVRGHNLRN